MIKITAADILKVVPITRKTLWLWQKKYKFFPDPSKEAHPGGKGIVGYYPEWVKARCEKVYALQKEGYTIAMIKDILKKEAEEKATNKVLVVDDEKKFAAILKKYLTRNGFLVEVANDGMEAGLKAAQFMPSIILLDITMPGLNGLEVCKNLKSNPTTQQMKIIIITAHVNYSEKSVEAAGADMFLRKPVDFKVLLDECKKFVAVPENL